MRDSKTMNRSRDIFDDITDMLPQIATYLNKTDTSYKLTKIQDIHMHQLNATPFIISHPSIKHVIHLHKSNNEYKTNI